MCLLPVPGNVFADDDAITDDDEAYLAPNWGSCYVDPLPPIVLPDDNIPEDELAVFSGSAKLSLDGNALFEDDISLVSGNRLLTASNARFDREAGIFTVEGEVEYRDSENWVRADRAELRQFSEELEFEGAAFQLWTVPARGFGEYIKADRDGKFRLKKVSYTSCPEGNDDWMLKASSIRIDQNQGIGTAKNARLEFKGVPFLYLPYISYPVTNERKTGWLIPKIGASQQRGVDIEAPFYWNIAPQYDATIMPRLMTKRGLQLNTEFRYLQQKSDGVLVAEYLPNDDRTDEHRALVGIEHTTNFTNIWQGRLNGAHVSDTNYFEDLSSGLSNTSQILLQRRADLEFWNDTWMAMLRFEDYQMLDDTLADTELPYTTLPKLTVRGMTPNGWLGMQYKLDSEIAYFYRDTGVTGLREYIRPEIALPLDVRFFEVEPAVGFDYTAYQLDDTAPNQEDSPSRAVPIYSIDTYTVFERITPKRGWLQTLEPRMLFTYIPFEDQSDLPVFDTIEPDLNVVQLFRKNRFVGNDRLGDTNQLSLGITTKLINASDGDEFMSATLGQILYFDDLDVTLPGEAPSDSKTSDYLFEFGMKLYENWRMRFGYQYNTDTDETQRIEARINYRASDRKLANVSYRFRRDALEEIDVSAAWPVTKNWSLVGRYDYSILDRKLLERFIGVEYDSCCWSIRGIWRRSLTDRTGESDTSFSVQLQLKGLGNHTSAADRWLDRGILEFY